jgi:hypothetical protein
LQEMMVEFGMDEVWLFCPNVYLCE